MDNQEKKENLTDNSEIQSEKLELNQMPSIEQAKKPRYSHREPYHLKRYDLKPKRPRTTTPRTYSIRLTFPNFEFMQGKNLSQEVNRLISQEIQRVQALREDEQHQSNLDYIYGRRRR